MLSTTPSGSDLLEGTRIHTLPRNVPVMARIGGVARCGRMVRRGTGQRRCNKQIRDNPKPSSRRRRVEVFVAQDEPQIELRCPECGGRYLVDQAALDDAQEHGRATGQDFYVVRCGEDVRLVPRAHQG